AEGQVGSAVVRRLRIDHIKAEDLHYHSGRLDVNVRRRTPADPPPLDITDVDVEGLHYERGRGITAGTLGVGTAYAAGGVDVAPGTAGGARISALGFLRARTISVRFAPGDRLTARAEHLDADAAVAYGSITGHASVTDLDTGGIEVSPERIRVGAGSQP